jgi:hypothetical protein
MDIYVEQGGEGPNLPLSSLSFGCSAPRRHAGPRLCRSRHVAARRGDGLEVRDAAEADYRRSRLDFRLRPEPASRCMRPIAATRRRFRSKAGVESRDSAPGNRHSYRRLASSQICRPEFHHPKLHRVLRLQLQADDRFVLSHEAWTIVATRSNRGWAMKRDSEVVL